MPKPRFRVVLTTTGTLKDAEKIAAALVRGRYAACVNVIPAVRSFYHWKGKFCSEAECLLVMKTTSSKVEALRKKLESIHPYELPEFIVLMIQKGSKRYLKWIEECVRFAAARRSPTVK